MKYTYTEDKKPTVQDGIVIADDAENQFVWIPVGTVTLNNGTTKKEIKLGRYTFDTTTGAPSTTAGSYQYAYTTENLTNYTNAVSFGVGDYQELSTRRDGTADTSNHLNDLNATAKDLAGFVNSVRTNGGYYLARYGSGYNSKESTDSERYGNAKPLSKASTACRTESDGSMNYAEGTLWNYITQLNASKVALSSESIISILLDTTN